jgi:mannose-6-phosphate isomerase-like protein (cupin superfamily)
MEKRGCIGFVTKLWGAERWIVNNALYCGKVLELDVGHQCSLHYHPIKSETFMVLSGIVRMEVGEKKFVMRTGDIVDVPAGTPHRFASEATRSELLEVSTPHSDNDVVRLEESQ